MAGKIRYSTFVLSKIEEGQCFFGIAAAGSRDTLFYRKKRTSPIAAYNNGHMIEDSANDFDLDASFFLGIPLLPVVLLFRYDNNSKRHLITSLTFSERYNIVKAYKKYKKTFKRKVIDQDKWAWFDPSEYL